MSETRIQRAVSLDGTQIVGRIVGEGPALVLVHGAIGDGEVAWEALLPALSQRFTCYLPSTRGRGLSEENPDHSPPRLVEDVTAFVDSIGGPVYLVGWSGSGAWVLGAAARSTAVVGVAVYEPTIIPLMGEQDLAETFETIGRMGAAAAEGRLVDAMRAFTPWICSAQETEALEQAGFYNSWASCVPAMLRFVQQDGEYDGPRPTDPENLASIDVPVLVMQGRDTRLQDFFTRSAQWIAQHAQDTQVWELPRLGHFAPVLAGESIADELTTFFDGARQPV